MKQTLTHLVLAGLLGLTTPACNLARTTTYHAGTIDQHYVILEKSWAPLDPEQVTLTIRTSRGRIVQCIDDVDSDLKVDSVLITEGGQTTHYTRNDPNSRIHLRRGQIVFDDYLDRIRELKSPRILLPF